MQRIPVASIMSNILVLSGPSGAGKTSIARALALKKEYMHVISHTTRAPRPTERDGVDYHFVSEKEFNCTEFLESADVFDYKYGTPKVQCGENVAILTIDPQGAKQIAQIPGLNILTIFVSADASTLEGRLVQRNSDTQHTVQKRMQKYEEFLNHAPLYRYHLINHNLDLTVEAVDLLCRGWFKFS